MEERLSGIEDKVEGMDSSVKENVKPKKKKSKYFQQYHTRKFPQPKEGAPSSSRYEKHTEYKIDKDRKEILHGTLNNQNTKHIEQRMLKAARGRKTSTI